MSICVIVADSGRARLLHAGSGLGALQEEQDFIHSQSRLREQDLVTDGNAVPTRLLRSARKDVGARFHCSMMDSSSSSNSNAAEISARV